MLKSVKVPDVFVPPFEKAEAYVERLFEDLVRRPEEGTIRIGGERYVLMRAESLYLTWFDALAETFGEEAAASFVYNTAREIGSADSRSFAKRLGVDDPIDRVASGPVHFAHAGWALVEILPDSSPAKDDSYFLHYYHPNTFESETARAAGRKLRAPGCLFSAGYSAGWCTAAFELEVHGREIRCVAAGDAHCEFIMAPRATLDGHQARLKV